MKFSYIFAPLLFFASCGELENFKKDSSSDQSPEPSSSEGGKGVETAKSEVEKSQGSSIAADSSKFTIQVKKLDVAGASTLEAGTFIPSSSAIKLISDTDSKLKTNWIESAKDGSAEIFILPCGLASDVGNASTPEFWTPVDLLVTPDNQALLVAQPKWDQEVSGDTTLRPLYAICGRAGDQFSVTIISGPSLGKGVVGFAVDQQNFHVLARKASELTHVIVSRDGGDIDVSKFDGLPSASGSGGMAVSILEKTIAGVFSVDANAPTSKTSMVFFQINSGSLAIQTTSLGEGECRQKGGLTNISGGNNWQTWCTGGKFQPYSIMSVTSDGVISKVESSHFGSSIRVGTENKLYTNTQSYAVADILGVDQSGAIQVVSYTVPGFDGPGGVGRLDDCESVSLSGRITCTGHSGFNSVEVDEFISWSLEGDEQYIYQTKEFTPDFVVLH